MPTLSLITGPPPALDVALAEEIRTHKSANPLAPITVLVGGSLLRPFLRARLATLLDGHINVRVVTPAELALRLGEPGLIAGERSPITPLADRAVAQELARAATSYFEPVRETPGFANALHRLFGELRAASIDPKQFAAASAGSTADTKLAELAELYRGYLTTRAPFYDAGDAMAGADAGRLDDHAVLVHDIWEMPARLRAMLEKVAERVPVTVLLPMTGSVADDAHREVRQWLVARGARVRELDSPAQSNDALGALHSRLFLDSTTAAPADATVTLLSAPDPTREAREAVRGCIAWANEGIGFHEMAIVYRHGEEYRGLIDQMLREAGIPAYLHEGTPLSERALGRQALALLELIDTQLPRAQVMQFIADGRFPQETWDRYGGISGPSWDALSRQAGVVQGPEQWAERLGLLRDGLKTRLSEDEDQPQWLLRRIEEIDRLTAFIADFTAAIARRPGSASWGEQLAYLSGLFSSYLKDAEGLTAALATLADLDALEQPVSAERFLQVVRAAIEGLRVSDVTDERQGAFARRGVNVLDVNSLRHLSFRAVAIVGLVERSFPPPPRQDPLLLDDEREVLRNSSAFDLPLRARGADGEALQFALAVGAAQERLQLSFARAQSAGGRGQLPSRFFRDAARALTGEPVRAARIDELPEWLFRRVSARQLASEDQSRALSIQEYERGLLEARPRLGSALLARTSSTVERALAAQTARWRTRELTAYDGVLGAEHLTSLLARVGPERALSPTALEAYAKCPYHFFLEKVIGLRELEEPEEIERIDALSRGSLIHRILQRFLEGLAGKRPSLKRRSSDLAELRRIALGECAAVELRGLTGYPALWRHDRQSLLEDLDSWYDVELADPEAGLYDNAAFEVRFGHAWADEETSAMSIDDPIEIDADGAHLRLTGRIDRLEWSSDGSRMRVIDYKSGSTWGAPEEDQVAGGKALQLPLYLLAAGQLLSRSPESGVGQYFYATRRGDFKRSEFHGGALAPDRADVPGLLHSLLQAIRGGDFHPESGKDKNGKDNKDNCKYCAFDRLCDSSRVKLRERKAQDPRAKAFVELTVSHP
jgi:ATP-dependent helicase/nuclease subunit B